MCLAVNILINPPNNLAWKVLLSHLSDEKNCLELKLWFKNHPGNMVMILGQKILGPLASLPAFQKKTSLGADEWDRKHDKSAISH